MRDLICYCYKHTREDIRQDYLENGRSLIFEKILAQKRMGACRCAEKNPEGR